MSGKQRIAVYDDFSGGEFGALGSWRAPKGSFTGQNVVRYVDGSLGPRNGIKALTVTGLPADILGSRMGIDRNGNLYFQVGTLVKTIDPTSTASQSSTAIGDAATDLAQGVLVGQYVYAITQGSGIKRLDFTTPAVTSVASSPNGTLLIQYGDRTLAAGNTSEKQRLYYSAAGNPESWPVGNYIDLGTGNTINSMIPLRGGVAIYTVTSAFTGLGGRWWILTGVPGVNETLREVLTGSQGPVNDADAAVPGDGVPTFAAAKSEVVGFFDGSKVSLLRHLSVGTLPALDVRSVVGLREESDVLVYSCDSATASSGSGLMRRDGAWFRHAFAEADVRHVLTTRDGVLVSDLQEVSSAQDLVIMATAAAPPVFYMWSAYNDRPPFADDYSASVLTAADVYFTLPDIQAERGEQISVRKVTVWFRDWNTGGSANQFNVTITPIHQYEAGDGTAQVSVDSAGVTPSFSRAASASSTGGVNLRREWTFAEDFGDSARIKVSDMRGVAIHRVEVVLDTKPELS